MTALIGITTAWSIETWGDLADQPGGILYSPLPYSNVIYQNGGLPVLLALPADVADHTEGQKIIDRALEHLSALFLSGGGGARRFQAPNMPGLEKQQPVRYQFEAMLLREAWKRQLPVIGACRGYQMMVEALGGKIKAETVSGHHQAAAEKTAHRVRVAKNTRLASLVGAGAWEVNSLHCQVAEAVPPGFSVTARSSEGYIEAMEADGPAFWMGFQFHPELMAAFDGKAQAVFKAFIDTAHRYGRNR